ncbi:MAG: transposase [Actinomycetota bacterium]|nr:transposase [Actinomycetota bacterium]
MTLRHRRHAQLENRIKNLKDTGLARLPFHDYDANRLWLELVIVAALLLAALQVLVDDDELAVAQPRRLRYTLVHVAARIARHARRTWLKLDRGWPWTSRPLPPAPPTRHRTRCPLTTPALSGRDIPLHTPPAQNRPVPKPRPRTHPRHRRPTERSGLANRNVDETLLT